MPDRPRNRSSVRRPTWTGARDEYAVLVGRGEPARDDAQMAEAVRAQVREYLTMWASVVADLVDVDAVADQVAADHVRPGTHVMLTRKHLLLYASTHLRPLDRDPADRRAAGRPWTLTEAAAALGVDLAALRAEMDAEGPGATTPT